MNLGCGLKWVNKWHGYPEIHLAIEAGDGIKVKYKGRKVIISTGDGETEDESYTPGGGGTVPGEDGDEGGGPGWEEGHGDGTTSGGGGISGAGGGGGMDGASGGDGGTSCNEFSEDLPNVDGDPGLANPADNCAILNGW